MLARWDTFFYYTIATDGYSWDAAVFRHYNVVFFPLYPMLMRWGGAALGGHPLLAGLIVSLTAFAGALVLLYRLALLELGDDHAWRVILLISTFPYALYFSAVYTESLFLLLSVGAFYAMRRGRLGWAAVCGLAAGLTRPNGFWLALPLALLAVWPPDRDRQRSSPRRPISLPLALLVACVPAIGVTIFSSYLQLRFGDALAWVHGQAAWGVPMLLRAGAPDPGKLPGEPLIKPIEVITWIGNIAAFVAAAYAIRPISRRLGLAYGVWIAVNIFPPVVAHLFMSLGRFTSVLFPLFFWMAIRIPRDTADARRRRLRRVSGRAGDLVLSVASRGVTTRSEETAATRSEETAESAETAEVSLVSFLKKASPRSLRSPRSRRREPVARSR